MGLLLAERDIRVRYKQTLLGVLWIVIQPLVAMVVFTVVLGDGVGVPSAGVPYAAFVLTGLAIWTPYNAAVSRAAGSLVDAPDLVTKVYFPRVLAPVGGVLGTIVDLGVAVLIAQVVAVIAGVPLQATAPLLVLVLPGFVFAALAFGVWLSALNVIYRDVGYALTFGMQLLFFATPIVYPLDVLGETLQTLAAVNPVVGVLDFTRWAMLGIDLDLGRLGISAASAVLLLGSGLVMFRRLEPQFADRM